MPTTSKSTPPNRAESSVSPATAASITTSSDTEDDFVADDVDAAKLLMKTNSGGVMKKLLEETKKTFGMAEGEHKTGDVIVETLDEGIELLKAHVAEMDRRLQEEKTGKDDDKCKGKSSLWFSSWMDLVPLNEFQATQEDFLIAFLKWSKKDEDEPSSRDKKKKNTKTSAATKSNVTKASRRLDSYFEWMRDNMAETLQERPLTFESVADAAKIWDIQVTIDENGRFIWWIDISLMNRLKEMAPLEHVRYVVWFSHMVMLDTNAQDNGAVIVENCGRIGFFKMMTLMPMELSAKLDRLTIGILPVKMKAIHMFGAATWMHVIIGMMKPFMSKKMRERMIIINEKKADLQAYCDNLVGGRKHIPDGFSGLQGDVQHDAYCEAWKTK